MMQSKKRARVASAKAKALLVGSANVTSSVVVSAHKELNAEGKKLEDANEEIMAELLQVNRSKLNTQPLIVINHINNSQKEKKKTSTSSNGSSKSPEKLVFNAKSTSVHTKICIWKRLMTFYNITTINTRRIDGLHRNVSNLTFITVADATKYTHWTKNARTTDQMQGQLLTNGGQPSAGLLLWLL